MAHRIAEQIPEIADIARHRGHTDTERDHLTTALPLFERIGAPDTEPTRQRLNALGPA